MSEQPPSEKAGRASVSIHQRNEPDTTYVCPNGCCVLTLAMPYAGPGHSHRGQELRCPICGRVLNSSKELKLMLSCLPVAATLPAGNGPATGVQNF